MLLSCIWLAELLGHEIDVSPVTNKDNPFAAANIAARLTSLGLEVEGLAYFDLPGVIVGRVDAVARHPEAGKLSVVELFDGTRTVRVVCGASNLPPPGGKVAFAPVGTVLPGGLELTERELRGVTSHGMICSEQELEIGSDASGILILPDDWQPGTPLQELVPGIRDAVIEISVTPNRPDALGHLGVARDLALALQARGVELRLPSVLGLDDVPQEDQLVTLVAGDRCPRYLGFALDSAVIAPAPLWMRVRLHRVGQRALNNVVDVTNFVLMETGQPMHAFDRQRLAGQRVVVRLASPGGPRALGGGEAQSLVSGGEPMTLLDGTKLELSNDDLVIADAESPQALAGVMGGEHSMVESSTTKLLLEVAYFEPRAIRRSARRYELSTDSSYRFERQVDYGAQLDFAAARALWLLREHAGAKLIARTDARAQLPERPVIRLDPAHVGRLLGMPVANDEVARILIGLGVSIEVPREGAWTCRPPSFRPDLGLAVDLVEEVMRHHGLDDLPARHSSSPEEREPLPEDPRRTLADALTDALRSQGLHEHVALAFIPEDRVQVLAGDVEPAELVRPRNPMSNQQAFMRPHLLPGLLDAVARNHARHPRELALFEVGRVYRWPQERPEPQAHATSEIDVWLPREPMRAAAIRARRGQSKLGEVARALTHDLLACLSRIGLHAEVRARAQGRPWLHPGIQASLWVTNCEGGEREIGVIGELHPEALAARDLSELELAYGELWIETLPSIPIVQFEEVARFPATSRDLSLDLDIHVPAQEAVTALLASAKTMASEGEDPVRLANADDPRHPILIVEDYRGEGVESGRRALLLRLHYRAAQRSVTDAEVQPLHDSLVAEALATLRWLDPAARVR
jgi:phenylalanyl-tRNA synthetase beta chain